METDDRRDAAPPAASGTTPPPCSASPVTTSSSRSAVGASAWCTGPCSPTSPGSWRSRCCRRAPSTTGPATASTASVAVLGMLGAHPHIISVFQSGYSDERRPYIVMEFMPGGSLANRLESMGALSWPEVLDIGVKVAGALHNAHLAGVLHRDLKPDNILVSAFGEPALADFGIAAVTGANTSRTGNLMASVAYAAPEVLEGKHATATADVYSFGATLFALLAAHVPHWRATDESVIPVVTRILTEAPPDLRRRGVPADVCAVVERALARDPADRFATAEDLGRALQAVQQAHDLTPTHLVFSLTALDQAGSGIAGRRASPGRPASPSARRARPHPPRAAPRPDVPGSTACRDAGGVVPPTSAPPHRNVGPGSLGPGLGLALGSPRPRRRARRPRTGQRTGGGPHARPAAALRRPDRGGTAAARPPDARSGSAGRPAPAPAPADGGERHRRVAVAGAALAALLGLGALVWSLAGGEGGGSGPSPTTAATTATTARATATTGPTTSAPTTAATAVTATTPVPDVSTQFATPTAVESALRTAGFAVTRVPTASPTVAAGTVIGLDPAIGTPLAPGATVRVLVSTGASEATVPAVDGLQADAAQAALEAAGFPVRRDVVESLFLAAGVVIETVPAAGTVELKGVTVVLRISSGPPAPATTAATTGPRTVTTGGGSAGTTPTTPTTPTTQTTSTQPSGPRIPSVVGLSPQAATARLQSEGFGASRGPDQCSSTGDGLVVSQSPGAGTSAESGAVVFFNVGSSLQC